MEVQKIIFEYEKMMEMELENSTIANWSRNWNLKIMLSIQWSKMFKIPVEWTVQWFFKFTFFTVVRKIQYIEKPRSSKALTFGHSVGSFFFQICVLGVVVLLDGTLHQERQKGGSWLGWRGWGFGRDNWMVYISLHFCLQTLILGIVDRTSVPPNLQL